VSSPRARHRPGQGFTLIEVVVALAVVAISMAAVIKTGADTTRNAAYLQDKTFAHWVAVDRLAELRLSGPPPSPGRSNGSAEMAGRQWFWRQVVSTTADKDVLRVEITVSGSEGEDAGPVARVTGFLASLGVAP
jgi:general secretion pathway protein I